MTDQCSPRELSAVVRGELSPEREAAQRDRFEKDLAEAKRLLPLLETGGLAAVEKVARRNKGVALIEALRARSWALRHDNPRSMVQYAWLAVCAAQSLDTRRYGALRVLDVQCSALADLGNAYRVADSLSRAEGAFEKAVKLYDLGTGDPDLGTRLLDLQASLYADQRRFSLASDALSLVYEHYRRQGNDHLAGRALISKGLYTGYAGEAEEAIGLLEKGLSLIEEEQEPGLVLAAVHNHIWFLVDLGRYRLAKRVLFQNRRRLKSGDGHINQLKIRWLEGRIDAGLGERTRAARTFEDVKKGFDAAGLGYQAALATLDLTAVLLHLNRSEEAELLVMDAVRVFSALHIHREALGAVLLLRKSFELRMASATLVEEVAAFMRRAEYDPEARFEPQPR